MRILVTGTAGFIGSFVATSLLDRGDEVIGIDNLNDYYDVSLKRDRLAKLTSRKGFTNVEAGLEDRDAVTRLFTEHRPQRVAHLAAQAGVRYSLKNPHAYADSNLLGMLNILEGCRNYDVEHLVYASSSSVYGANTKMPFSVHDNVDHPVSLYAVTKTVKELMAHSYSHLYSLPTTGLRFFTVYGPWGRPDMAYFSFTQKILAGEPIDVFNFGKCQRDFTYIDDIVEGVIRTLDSVPTAADSEGDGCDQTDPSRSHAPYRVYNIGNNQPVELLYFIQVIEKALGKKAEMNLMPLQPGDVPATFADIDDLMRDVGFKPSTPIEVGIGRFVEWYMTYYGV